MIRPRHAKHALQVRIKRSTRVSHSLGRATEATSNKIGTRMERILACFKSAKCVQSVFNAPVARLELIRDV